MKKYVKPALRKIEIRLSGLLALSTDNTHQAKGQSQGISVLSNKKEQSNWGPSDWGAPLWSDSEDTNK